MPKTDAEIIEALKEIDEADNISVTDWEGDFLDSIKKTKARTLTPKQRVAAMRMIDKYAKALVQQSDIDDSEDED